MKEYMYIFRNVKGAEEAFAKMSPQEMEADMKTWNDWMGKLAHSGNLVGGQPLMPSGKVVRPGKKITDGPFVEGKDIVGGYVVVKAKDLDDAIAISDGCPVYKAPGGSVEVREVMPIPQA